MNNKVICILCGLLLFSTFTRAQVTENEGTISNTASTTVVLGVSEVSLLKTSADIVNLKLVQQEAGLSIGTNASDSTARLLISSVISTSTPRTLTAKITAGTVPSGTFLMLVALQPNSNFVGKTGTLASSSILDETDKAIITNIETCYSGTGSADGYPLKFIYGLNSDPSTYGSLRASLGTQIVVTLTLTAAQ
ncbi:MAG TPA: hypothetical protein VFP20_07680 [Bacteroidales bacterium]|nr:hypothetical protein [Bacteroidales bacterium]